MHGVLGAVHRRSAASPTIFDVDFTALSAGAQSSALPGGFLLTRASAATVQTGDSAIDSTPGVDVARVGRRLTAALLGLLVEESRTNYVLDSRNPSTANWNTASGETPTRPFGTGPDGDATTPTRHVMTSGGFSRYSQRTQANAFYTFSQWEIRGSVGGLAQMTVGINSAISLASGGTASAAWSRRVLGPLNHTAGTAVTLVPSDSRDWSTSGGIVAGARDAATDCHQIEAGKFVTEFIAAGGANTTRAGERLYLPSGNALVTGGQIRLYVRCTPKGARADYPGDVYLWSYDANNYCKVSNAGVLTVAIAGVTNTTSAITWSQYDDLELFVVAGAGLATVVKYRVNAGATQVPTITGSALNSLSMVGATDVLCNGTSNQFTAWVHRVSAYAALQSPGWA